MDDIEIERRGRHALHDAGSHPDYDELDPCFHQQLQRLRAGAAGGRGAREWARGYFDHRAVSSSSMASNGSIRAMEAGPSSEQALDAGL